jgi:hypothetical protein
MKTIYLLFAGVFVLNSVLFAQRTSFQIGLNAVPLFNKTVELNATLAGNAGYEFFIHGGYSFPKFYQTNRNEDYNQYWEGTASGAYLKLGARAYLNETGKFRIYLGPQLTAGYLYQAGKSITVINCIIAPCPRLEGEGKNKQYLLSGGITAGVRTTNPAFGPGFRGAGQSVYLRKTGFNDQSGLCAGCWSKTVSRGCVGPV